MHEQSVICNILNLNDLDTREYFVEHLIVDYLKFLAIIWLYSI